MNKDLRPNTLLCWASSLPRRERHIGARAPPSVPTGRRVFHCPYSPTDSGVATEHGNRQDLRHDPARRRAVARASRSTSREKLEIAEQLARLGVDIIEAGFPIASQGDFESVEAIAKAVHGPDDRRPLAHRRSRTSTGRGKRCGTPAKPRIHVFIATSKIHMEKKLRMTPEQVKAEAAAAVARARGYATTSSSHPRTATAPIPTSCARSARSRSTTAPRRSTSPTRSASRFPRTTGS